MSSDSDFLREIKETFLAEVRELMDSAEEALMTLERDPSDEAAREAVFRLLHNMKGSSKAVGFDSLSLFVHEIENLFVKIRNNEVLPSPEVINVLLRSNDLLKKTITELQKDLDREFDFSQAINEIQMVLTPKHVSVDAPRTQEVKSEIVEASSEGQADEALNAEARNDLAKEPGASAHSGQSPNGEKNPRVTPKGAGERNARVEEFIKLPLSRVENLINYLGEQVLLQSILEHAKKDINRNEMLMQKTINQLSKITYDIQQIAISLRMVSIRNLFNKMDRIARDTSQILNKRIRFEMSGTDSEIDKTIADALGDPLTHMVRNAIDHGMEDANERVTVGKDPVGTIKLSAFRRGSHFYIEIEDDGRGMDPEKILEKGIRKGLVDEKLAPLMSQAEIFELIFKSGFSTKEVTTEYSGRGVGMDVVRNTITKLKGTCEIESEKGKGTRFIIRLPITLAIFNGAVVRLGGERFVFPNSDIEEIISIDTRTFKPLNSREVMVQIKDEVVPVLDARKLLKVKVETQTEESFEDHRKILLVSRLDQKVYGILVDEVLSQQRVVLKNLGLETAAAPGIAGGTILGDGKVALIVELPDLIHNHMGVA